MTVHRLFFALRPPVREARLIGLVRDALPGAESVVSNERLHMTLGITEDHARLPDSLVDRMMAIGDTIEGEPFAVRLDRMSGSMRSVALRPTGQPRAMADLQRQLARLIDYWGLGRAEWSFSPHVTLLYWAGQPFIRPVSPIEWDAAELLLIHSLVGENRHIVLGRWPLLQRQHAMLF